MIACVLVAFFVLLGLTVLALGIPYPFQSLPLQSRKPARRRHFWVLLRLLLEAVPFASLFAGAKTSFDPFLALSIEGIAWACVPFYSNSGTQLRVRVDKRS